jgi:hypothetical protein
VTAAQPGRSSGVSEQAAAVLESLACADCGCHVSMHHVAGGRTTTFYGPPEEGFPASACTCDGPFASVTADALAAAGLLLATEPSGHGTTLSDDGPPDDRLLAMVRRSLVQTRPMTEVDAICETLQRRLAARSPAAADETLRARVAALANEFDECWVTRSDVHCIRFVDVEFGSGIWTETMCCLPCRLRALLDTTTEADQ